MDILLKVIGLNIWGLIPFWIKDYSAAITIQEKTLNARNQTILQKACFKHSILSKLNTSNPDVIKREEYPELSTI
jgi:hypothetical protein